MRDLAGEGVSVSDPKNPKTTRRSLVIVPSHTPNVLAASHPGIDVRRRPVVILRTMKGVWFWTFSPKPHIGQ